MSPSSNQPEKNRAQYAFNLTLAVVAGQVGCLTLLIVVGALFGGLWLDSRFQTKPMITVGLMVLSVPITLVVMFWVVRTATSRLQAKTEQESENLQEEAIGGE